MLEVRTWRGKLVLQVLITVAAAFFVLPLIALIQGSASGQGWLVNYGAVFRQPELPLFFLNSMLIAVGVIAITYVCSMLAAFAFAKLALRFREVLFYSLLVALTLPTVALTLPLYFTLQQLGLFDTPLAVILPLAAILTSFNVLLVRGFMAALPDELFDAARVDGATDLRIFWSIVLPLSKPIAAVIVIWSFIGAWNEFLLPLLFLQTTNQQTLTLLPTFFASQYTSDPTKIMAASAVIAVPTVIVYLAFQKLFEQGLTAGALK